MTTHSLQIEIEIQSFFKHFSQVLEVLAGSVVPLSDSVNAIRMPHKFRPMGVFTAERCAEKKDMFPLCFGLFGCT